MDPSDFRIDDSGNWFADLPPELGMFYGRPIGVSIDRFKPEQRNQPADRDMKLLAIILAGLPEILQRAKTEFDQFEGDSDPAFIEHLVNPQIWIPSDDNKHPDDWTFVLERDDWSGYGCHIEFRGCEFQKIWGGD